MKTIKINKYLKIILIIILLLVLFMNCYKVQAFGFKDLSGTSVNNSEAMKVGNKVITTISTIGSIISVVALVVIGIKYMTGSIEEKAEYKKSLLPYFIGSIIVFLASTLAGYLYNMVIKFIWYEHKFLKKYKKIR